MSYYPIFPSLSRAPDFATSRKIDDGTLSDPKESGYVSTRPRFTRLRRSWSVAWKNLTEEDVRVLDKFEVSTVRGGADAFYLPNLLSNGSFESFEHDQFGDLFLDGWSIQPTTHQWVTAPVISPSAFDGSYALGLSLGSTAPLDVSGQGVAILAPSLSVSPGDAYLFSAKVLASATLPTGATFTTQPFFTFDVGAQIYPTAVTSSSASWVDYEVPIAIPVGASRVTVGILAFASKGSSSNTTLGSGNSINILWDECGFALTSAVQKYGRMIGTTSPGAAVRFTKGLDIKDAKPADGVKRYDATCEVTEL